MPNAHKIRRPSKYRGHTNYAIDGHEGRFRYIQGGDIYNQDGLGNPRWTATDAPRVINGTLCVVAALGTRHGLFARIDDPSQTY